MGYEIKLIIGKACQASTEYELDKTLQFAYGSGNPHKKDAKGDLIPTGRKRRYFLQMATVDLCKLGYQDDALNRLIARSFEIGKERNATEFVEVYINSDQATSEDRYGSIMWPTPIGDVLAAMKESHGDDDYRRTKWAIALLESMVDDPEGLEVLFYGH